jgi:general secretion pathway protein M
MKMTLPFAEQTRAALAQGQARFNALTARERWMVGGCALVLAYLLLYLGLWAPVVSAHDRRETAIADARLIAERLEAAGALAQGQRGSQPRGGQAAGSLLSQVDQSLKTSKIGKPAERVQPEGDQEVRVWLTGVPFDAVVRWIGELQQHYGIAVQTLDVERQTEPGVVDARLSLVRG